MDYGIVKLILLPQELIRPIRLPAGLIFKGGTISGNSKSSQTRHSKDYCIFTERMKHSKYIFLAVLATLLENCMAAHTCVVDSFTVKEHFDLKRYGGKWYALAKKDPEGLFLQDNISAEYTIGEDGIMTASSKGRVKLFGFWVICADMAAHYSIPDPAYPAKMYMIYQGLASYLSSGGNAVVNSWLRDLFPASALNKDSCDFGRLK
ncbi:hypothetical protein NDU88_000579 [Pleurodeles waltl]|uniref:Lipocalin/cytosolic fatty-acid binding domain-containing protein n=1 Tax=Pleurodeles waltl TaxID=8319 RepID=A0AAV7VTY6_PLEWA|nr:hypothetical protein NDU88_000579 [Pleurodeles waltl]